MAFYAELATEPSCRNRNRRILKPNQTEPNRSAGFLLKVLWINYQIYQKNKETNWTSYDSFQRIWQELWILPYFFQIPRALDIIKHRNGFHPFPYSILNVPYAGKQLANKSSSLIHNPDKKYYILTRQCYPIRTVQNKRNIRPCKTL